VKTSQRILRFTDVATGCPQSYGAQFNIVLNVDWIIKKYRKFAKGALKRAPISQNGASAKFIKFETIETW
jgi:hypothetical protein